MIVWYSDKELEIAFSDKPCVAIRYALPTSTEQEKKSIKKYPFICKRTLEVEILDKQKQKKYNFIIPKNYCYDGCTIPRFAWSLIGVSKENNGGLIASLCHDYLTTNRNLINNDRALSTNIFNALLNVGGINAFKRFIMKNSVAFYQTVFSNWDI